MTEKPTMYAELQEQILGQTLEEPDTYSGDKPGTVRPLQDHWKHIYSTRHSAEQCTELQRISDNNTI